MNLNRSLISRSIIGAAILVALLVAVLPSSADLISYSITCTSTTMDVVPDTTGDDFGHLTITANGEEIAYVQTDAWGDDAPYTANYSLPTGSYTIEANWTNQSPTENYTVSQNVNCAGDTTGSYGNICFGPGEVASAMYLYASGVNIYSIVNDEGQLSISVDSETLYGTAIDPTGDVVIATASDVLPTTLYRQIDGNFRVVVGPEPLEGKTYECVFNAGCAVSRSWLPGQEPYAPLQLVCQPATVVTTPEFTPTIDPSFTPSVDDPTQLK